MRLIRFIWLNAAPNWGPMPIIEGMIRRGPSTHHAKPYASPRAAPLGGRRAAGSAPNRAP